MYESLSVTARVKSIKQPHGGYLPVKAFQVIELDDGQVLSEAENIHASVIGMVVDYLTRFMMGTPLRSAFQISLEGASQAKRCGGLRMWRAERDAKAYLSKIKGIDDTSIINACKLVTFDVWYRQPASVAALAKPAKEINPDVATVRNIQILVQRCLAFWEKYGPIVCDGFTFEGGYTGTVSSGDGDYLTADTLWDFKVSANKLTSKHTLQILMYWIMGYHSVHQEFKRIKKLAFYNPRLNRVYQYDLSNLSDEVIRAVEDDVICYKDYYNPRINSTSILEMREHGKS